MSNRKRKAAGLPLAAMTTSLALVVLATGGEACSAASNGRVISPASAGR